MVFQNRGLARLLQGPEHELGEGTHRRRHILHHLRHHQVLSPRCRAAHYLGNITVQTQVKNLITVVILLELYYNVVITNYFLAANKY